MSDAASRMQDKASELGQKASDLGHHAVEAIDARRGAAASGLDSAAVGLHANADKLPSSVSRVAHKTADSLEATATYVRDNRLRDMWSGLEEVVKAHPTQAILGTVVVGFLVGRMMRRD